MFITSETRECVHGKRRECAQCVEHGYFGPLQDAVSPTYEEFDLMEYLLLRGLA